MDALILLYPWVSRELFHTVMSFNEASEDTGFHCFSSSAAVAVMLAFSYSLSLLPSFTPSVRGDCQEDDHLETTDRT